jgi:hypothetical protein
MKKIKQFLIGIIGIIGIFSVFLIWHFLLLIFEFICTFWVYVRTVNHMRHSGFDIRHAILVPLLTIMTGIGIGINLLPTSPGAIIVAMPIVTAAPLIIILVYPRIQHHRLVDHYQRHEKYLIQP